MVVCAGIASFQWIRKYKDDEQQQAHESRRQTAEAKIARGLADPKDSVRERDALWFGHYSRRPSTAAREHWCTDDIEVNQTAIVSLDHSDDTRVGVELARVVDMLDADGSPGSEILIAYLRPSAVLDKSRKNVVKDPSALTPAEVILSTYDDYPKLHIPKNEQANIVRLNQSPDRGWFAKVKLDNVIYSEEPRWKQGLRAFSNPMVEALITYWFLAGNLEHARAAQDAYKKDVRQKEARFNESLVEELLDQNVHLVGAKNVPSTQEQTTSKGSKRKATVADNQTINNYRRRPKR